MEKVKAFFITVATLLSSWLGILAIPVYLLVCANIIDYGTGLGAAPYRGEQRSSYKGIRGIVKKVCMWLLVMVGAMMDMLLYFAADTLGWSMPVKSIVACLVCVWLLANELISILENISDIGVEIPVFLMPLVKWVKQKSEDAGQLGQEAKQSD